MEGLDIMPAKKRHSVAVEILSVKLH